jgi:hypothetical protein
MTGAAAPTVEYEYRLQRPPAARRKSRRLAQLIVPQPSPRRPRPVSRRARTGESEHQKSRLPATVPSQTYPQSVKLSIHSRGSAGSNLSADSRSFNPQRPYRWRPIRPEMDDSQQSRPRSAGCRSVRNAITHTAPAKRSLLVRWGSHRWRASRRAHAPAEVEAGLPPAGAGVPQFATSARCASETHRSDHRSWR